MEYYKVTQKLDPLGHTSYGIVHFLTSYHLEIMTKRKQGCGPLCAFSNHQDVLNYVRQSFLFRIPGLMILAGEGKVSEDIGWWQAGNRQSKSLEEVSDLLQLFVQAAPLGTVYLDYFIPKRIIAER